MGNSVGRPRKEIDKRQFESLCGIQCTEEEICDVLGVTDKTPAKWCNETYGLKFSEVFRQKRTLGKASLRRTQWRHAEKNVTMAIFLGKQYLGQTDKIENDIKADAEIKVQNAFKELTVEELKKLASLKDD